MDDGTGDGARPHFLAGGGEMAALIARHDWAGTPIGPIADWPAEMRTVLGFVLRSRIPMVTLWGARGVMIYNDAYRGFSGDRHPALLGRDVLDGWPEAADFNAQVMEAVYRDGGTLSYRDRELVLVRDGTPRTLWANLEYSPAIGPAGRPIGVVAIVVETTDKVLAGRRLEDDRDRLWSISRDLLMVADMRGIITAVNPSATRLLGWQPGEMVGRSIAAFVHPDDMGSTAAEMAALAGGATTLSFGNRCRTRDGDYRLLSWTVVSDAGRIHAAGRDVTEERRLARDRERIWTLSPVLKVVTDRRGIITDVNPSWTSTLGWSREETVGRRSTDFMVDDEEWWRSRVRTLASGTPLLDYDTVLKTRDGQRRLVKWSTVPENDTFYGFGRDVTAEAEAAAALAETEAALRQSQKMEAVGQLTGGIAHDFNNLLQGISGSLEIVQRRIAAGRIGDLDRFIDGAAAATQRAAALTHRLLAFSRRQPLDPRPVDANALVASMEDMVRRTIGEDIALRLDLADGLWTTRCDANQLESAILNLVINARDAMPGGGALTIATRNADLSRPPAARTRGVTPGRYVEVEVADSGVGMDAATLARVFEPFFTTKPMGQGTGLGLSMIYGFAQQSEGHARIESVPDTGTCVRLYLPRWQDPAAPVGPVHDPLPGPRAASRPGSGETVLVIEDEAVVRHLVIEELRELGYAPLVAEDGPAGLAVLRSAARIDLLLTDIGLPGLDGRQVADMAREMRPDLKVLFMTGYAENAAAAAGFLTPGMALITKPFVLHALAARIRAMLEQ